MPFFSCPWFFWRKMGLSFFRKSHVLHYADCFLVTSFILLLHSCILCKLVVKSKDLTSFISFHFTLFHFSKMYLIHYEEHNDCSLLMTLRLSILFRCCLLDPSISKFLNCCLNPLTHLGLQNGYFLILHTHTYTHAHTHSHTFLFIKDSWLALKKSNCHAMHSPKERGPCVTEVMSPANS